MRGADPTARPLLAPVPREGWTQPIRQMFAISEGERCLTEGTRFNVQAVMANHPELATAWVTYNRFITRDLELSDQLREIAILRTAWNLQAGYEWYQHRISGRRHGLTEDQLEALGGDVTATVWRDEERLVIQAADEICANACASEATINAILEHFGPRQLMEILWTIGTYGMLGWIINSLRVPIEDFCIT